MAAAAVFFWHGHGSAHPVLDHPAFGLALYWWSNTRRDGAT